jgi:hypothetical protein
MERSCGVLVDLENIQALFHPGLQVSPEHESSDVGGSIPTPVDVDVYPLYFLRTVGNIKANGHPHCFYPLLTRVNKNISDLPYSEYNPDNEDDEDDDNNLHLDGISADPIVFPVSSQIYNRATHRIASRSGCLDIQHGSVASSLAGAFAQSAKDEQIAKQTQDYCDDSLPSDRSSLEDCPTHCCSEFVYAVDVQKIKSPSGM